MNNQWRPQQPLYSQQTGFNPQLQPQATGYPFLATQPTGFTQPSSFSQPQPQHPANALLNPQQQQQSRFLASSPAQGGLVPQQTGWGGTPGLSPGGLVPQITGYQNPQMAMMSSALMPSNVPGLPQFQSSYGGAAGGASLQQSIQQHNQANRGTSTQNISWALSKDERKSYDQIFRAWDSKGTGFISGNIALEVFGQSGLPQDDLAKIWALADSTNRGSLNLPEFHVAMGLIYRHLNGSGLPDVLPPELVPPSERDLDSSVNFLKDILSKDSHERATNGSSSAPSYAKSRSLYDSSPSGGATGARKDGSAYVFNDKDVKGYRSNSRHVDRKAVRYGGESAADDLSEIKRQLQNTAYQLDKDAEEAAARTEEDEQLDEEMDDVKYRVRRVQEDLDRASRGPKSAARDEERRRLERELLHLMHERLPELERRVEKRDQRKKEEKDSWARDRNKRNDKAYSSSRYDDRDRYDEDREDDRGYLRGSYDRDERDRDRDRDRDYRRRDQKDSYERDRDRDRYERNRDGGRARSPQISSARSPPPAALARSPPPAPQPSSPAPTATPTSSTLTARTTNAMTPEERAAFIRAEAQRRMRERMTALGVTSPAPSSPATSSVAEPVVDVGVEERLVQERMEAEEKAKKAEREAEEREAARKARLEEAKGIKSAAVAPPKPAPPPVKSRAPAPPPPVRHGSKGAPPPPPSKRAAIPPVPPTAQARIQPPPPPAPKVQEDEEEKEFKRREDALRARNERLRQLEEEARLQEEKLQKRRAILEAKEKEKELEAKQAIPAPAVISTPLPPVTATATSPPPPPPPPAPTTLSSPPAPTSGAGTTNPFHLMSQQKSSPAGTPSTNGTSATGGGGGGFNPFFNRQQPVAPTTAPQVSAPPAPRTPVYRPQADETDDEWDTPKDKEGNESDSSNDSDEYASRTKMGNIAETIFGKGGGVSRPTSAGPLSQPNRTGSVPPGAARETKSAFVVPPTAPPPPPPAPEFAVANPVMGGFGAPPPPPPPAPPVSSSVPVVPPPAGERSALLGAIQAGARLRKASTNDRSAASVSGKVIGDADPSPASSSAISPMVMQPPPSIQTPASTSEVESYPMASAEGMGASGSSSHRQSVDWYAGLAADGGVPRMEVMDSLKEEEDGPAAYSVPEIQVTSTDAGDGLEDVDFGTSIKVRSLYPYDGQRSEDLSFAENLVINAHPSKSGEVWWYGTLIKDGNKGFFPNTYVQEVEQVRAKVKYAYEALNPDEMTCNEGQIIDILDQSDPDWWKTEKNGVLLVVPASYMEVVNG